MKRALLICWLIACQLSGLGCQSLKLWDKAPEVDDDDDEGPIKTVYIADQVNIAGLHPITVEAVGLVTGLDNTGDDPPPSMWRTMLTEDMKRRGIKNPNTWLKSPKNTLVLIRAAIPPVIQYGDHFDVEVVLPEGSNTTSLAGGWLMEADLAERFEPVAGRIQKGHVLAKCQGPLMVSAGDGTKDSQAALLKRGKVLGGAVYVGGLLREDRKLGLYLRNDFKSKRQTIKISDRIANRFHNHEKGIKKGLATAKTDQHIELKVHPRYKDNYYRYLQVIRRIAMNETPVQQRRRIERLRRSLLVPDKASISALELEAIGKDGIPILKEGLRSPIAEVQFYAADSLAYLDDPSGVEVLTKMAREEPAFRVFALTSLTNLEAVAAEPLKEMMNDPSAETRYGAFHSLQVLDKHDPFLAKERIGDQFSMYSLRTKGEPMVHLTKHRVSEVVLFGTEQRLQPPFHLEAGRHILVNAQGGSDTVTISRFEADKPDRTKTVSTRLADVIRAIGELGATYPDTAQLLTQAKNSACLGSRLEFDAMPQGGRIYHRPPTVAGGKHSSSKTEIGSISGAPNLFPAVKDGMQTLPTEGSSTGTSSAPEGRADDRLASNTGDDSSSSEEEEEQPEKNGVLDRLFPQRSAPAGTTSKKQVKRKKKASTESKSTAEKPDSPKEAGGAPRQEASSKRESGSRPEASSSPREPAIDEIVFDESEPAAEGKSARPAKPSREGSGKSPAAAKAADASVNDPFANLQ